MASVGQRVLVPSMLSAPRATRLPPWKTDFRRPRSLDDGRAVRTFLDHKALGEARRHLCPTRPPGKGGHDPHALGTPPLAGTRHRIAGAGSRPNARTDGARVAGRLARRSSLTALASSDRARLRFQALPTSRIATPLNCSTLTGRIMSTSPKRVTRAPRRGPDTERGSHVPRPDRGRAEHSQGA